MILIIGGAYQGKRQFAREKLGNLPVVDNLHTLILKQLELDIDPIIYVKNHLVEWKDSVVICDDISCGVVPIDPLMRKWREAVGHSLAIIAREADSVFRLFCGIESRLK